MKHGQGSTPNYIQLGFSTALCTVISFLYRIERHRQQSRLQRWSSCTSCKTATFSPKRGKAEVQQFAMQKGRRIMGSREKNENFFVGHWKERKLHSPKSEIWPTATVSIYLFIYL